MERWRLVKMGAIAMFAIAGVSWARSASSIDTMAYSPRSFSWGCFVYHEQSLHVAHREGRIFVTAYWLDVPAAAMDLMTPRRGGSLQRWSRPVEELKSPISWFRFESKDNWAVMGLGISNERVRDYVVRGLIVPHWLVMMALGVTGRAALLRERRAREEGRGRCPACAYDIRGVLDGGCPECGWGRAL